MSKIEDIYLSSRVRLITTRICIKQGRYDLIDDLLNFCMMKLIEKDIEVDEDYFIGMVVNQMSSNTSEFYRIYRNYGNSNKFITNEVVEDIIEDNIFNIDKRILNDINDDKKLNDIKKAMLLCDPLKVELFKMKYYDCLSHKEISEFYNIPIRSVIKMVKSVRENIRVLLNSSFSREEVIKRRNELRRLNESKILMDRDRINIIVDDFNSGLTKKTLSYKYNVSYPFILKIINGNG